MLYLLPNALDPESTQELLLPNDLVPSLDGLIAESAREGRRFLRRFGVRELPMAILDEHVIDLAPLLAPLARGEKWGLVSDGGLPCIADPGSNLVWAARAQGIPVQTFPGPSSIIMALQLSGCCGQRFAFHGYPPREIPERKAKILAMEMRSRRELASQIWIEAPYKSGHMLHALCEALQPRTVLCVAASLATPQERVVSQKVEQWRRMEFVLGKEPAIFLIDAALKETVR
jgi:16S rRNA (cytidine1402-2'-O)-methyltransferase